MKLVQSKHILYCFHSFFILLVFLHFIPYNRVCVCVCVIPHSKAVATTTTTTTIVWIHYNMVNRLKLKHTGTTVDGIEGIGKDKRQDSHQLHDNVEGRS